MHHKVIDKFLTMSFPTYHFLELYSEEGKYNKIFLLLPYSLIENILNVVNCFCFKTAKYFLNPFTNQSLATVTGMDEILPAIPRFILIICRMSFIKSVCVYVLHHIEYLLIMKFACLKT